MYEKTTRHWLNICNFLSELRKRQIKNLKNAELKFFVQDGSKSV